MTNIFFRFLGSTALGGNTRKEQTFGAKFSPTFGVRGSNFFVIKWGKISSSFTPNFVSVRSTPRPQTNFYRNSADAMLLLACYCPCRLAYRPASLHCTRLMLERRMHNSSLFRIFRPLEVGRRPSGKASCIEACTQCKA